MPPKTAGANMPDSPEDQPVKDTKAKPSSEPRLDKGPKRNENGSFQPARYRLGSGSIRRDC